MGWSKESPNTFPRSWILAMKLPIGIVPFRVHNLIQYNDCYLWNEVFSGIQPCEFGVNVQHFGDGPCVHNQELMWWETWQHIVFMPKACCWSPVSCLSANYYGNSRQSRASSHYSSCCLTGTPMNACFCLFSIPLLFDGPKWSMLVAGYHEWLNGSQISMISFTKQSM